jgi:hypothetical protein
MQAGYRLYDRDIYLIIRLPLRFVNDARISASPLLPSHRPCCGASRLQAQIRRNAGALADGEQGNRSFAGDSSLLRDYLPIYSLVLT